jgi:hypothetical protein
VRAKSNPKKRGPERQNRDDRLRPLIEAKTPAPVDIAAFARRAGEIIARAMLATNKRFIRKR